MVVGDRLRRRIYFFTKLQWKSFAKWADRFQVVIVNGVEESEILFRVLQLEQKEMMLACEKAQLVPDR